MHSRMRKKQNEKLVSQFILVIVVVALMILLWLSQRERLDNYNDWYMCEIYGHVEYCVEGGENL